MGLPVTIRGDGQARLCLAQGIRLAARAIAPSLGPKGRTVLLHRPPAPPVLLTHGYDIAREVAASCHGPEAHGARILKETLFEVDRDFGDGTSAVALMMASIVSAAVPLAHARLPMGEVADALLELAPELRGKIQSYRVDARFDDIALAVARTAARDEEIAHRIGALFLELGGDTVIQVQEGEGRDIESDIRPGTTIEASLVSRHLSDDPDRILVQLKEPYILVADEEISDFGSLLPVLEGFATKQKSLLIVARDVTGAALQALVRNKAEAGLRVAALKVGSVAERGYDALEDLAIATGAELLSDRFGTDLRKMRPQMLGRAEEAKVEQNFTTVIGGAACGGALETRRKEIRQRILDERYLSYDREQLELRLARLGRGFARLHIGGVTSADRSIRLMAARKAVAGLQAARSGVVPGGGTVFLQLAGGLAAGSGDGGSRQLARRLARKALRQIPATMIGNAGEDPLVWLGRLEGAKTANVGLDLETMAFGDLRQAGILDPASVLGAAIERAFSAAATLLRADLLVTS
ncbi:60 kDa chaperonin [Hypericibacter terrae]|uniref:60 kDa chaperonin n=1 Tax=Hypericibacter terrae TaxID=2602015 RepID=A0A5J6MGM0_9PROT|nr:TCP-1/cpn60 chaperonin family protein [Hypericibacter terrae]QEX16603.1 60 kDa chaperonin [Hypericibacter terrae]